ncbi:biotin/lipoyl-containing protein, partial [Bradyrhizobium oligotrophicum]
EIRLDGHAIEVRLCSEDAANDFMPQSGRMALWRMPGAIRVEHALESGAQIPPFYDSMIAKLISHGATRDEARARLIAGLEQAAALGVTTNQAFLLSCLQHPAFAAGKATTAFIGAHRDELRAAAVDAEAIALAALLLSVSHPLAHPVRGGRSLAAAFATPLRFEIGGEVRECELLRERDGSYCVAYDGAEHRFDVMAFEGDTLRVRHAGIAESLRFVRDGDRLFVQHRGQTLALRDLTLAAPQSAAVAGGDGKVRAALNGRVVAVLVKPGDRVAVGQPVVTLEAMKMEHVHAAGIAGTVATIDVSEGDQVTTGRIVAEIAG